jgi:Transcriptional regulators
MSHLEPIDATILKTLLADGRTSFQEIAHITGTSEESIRMHYRELEKSGIIVGATTQVNYLKLGYTGIARIKLQVASQKVSETYENISKIPNVIPSYIFCSPFSVGAVANLKDLNSLELIKQRIYQRSFVNSSQIYIWTDARNRPENVLNENADESIPHLNSNINTPFQMDDYSAQIIEILSANARLPFKQVAEQIGTSEQTVARRYKALRDNNIIKPVIRINPKLLGYGLSAEFTIQLTDPNVKNEVADKLSAIPGVSYVLKVSGNFDLALRAIVKSCEGLLEVNKKILQIPNIQRFETGFSEPRPAWPIPRELITTF